MNQLNYEIRKLSEDLIALLNASQAPIEAKRLVVKDVLMAVEAKANEIIAEEQSSKEDSENGI